jgi:hypothetical protein
MRGEVQWWEVVSAVGTAAGAIAAAVGAFAAWRAASASRATSRDALEALAVGIRPALEVRFVVLGNTTGSHHAAIVDNVSEWPATHLVFDMRFRDGHAISERAERLDPARGDGQAPNDGRWTPVLAPAEPRTTFFAEIADSAVLRYSDDRGIARYEQSFRFNFTKTRNGSIVSTGASIDFDQRRI